MQVSKKEKEKKVALNSIHLRFRKQYERIQTKNPKVFFKSVVFKLKVSYLFRILIQRITFWQFIMFTDHNYHSGLCYDYDHTLTLIQVIHLSIL